MSTTALIAAEFTKLRRSLAWAVVIGLPVIMVFAASYATLSSDAGLTDGWHTLWMRSMVFHGLFPLTLGIGIMASLVWRHEHRNGNWNALLCTPASTTRIVLSKILTVTALAAAMQLCLVLSLIAVGKLVYNLPALPPGRYLLVSALLVVTVLPLAALQSGLSMIIRSFAGPIALAGLGAAVALGLSLTEAPVLPYLLPHGLTARTTQLATGTFGDPGSLNAATAFGLLMAAAVATVMIIFWSVRHLERSDVAG